jgi:hypothetical protein
MMNPCPFYLAGDLYFGDLMLTSSTQCHQASNVKLHLILLLDILVTDRLLLLLLILSILEKS